MRVVARARALTFPVRQVEQAGSQVLILAGPIAQHILFSLAHSQVKNQGLQSLLKSAHDRHQFHWLGNATNEEETSMVVCLTGVAPQRMTTDVTSAMGTRGFRVLLIM